MPIESSRARTTITGYAIMYIASPSTCAANPVPSPVTSCVKNRNSATPIAISGVMNENSMTKFAVPEPRPRQRSSASANATPSGTAITTVRPASLKLCSSACRSSGSSNTELTFPTYHCVDRPCQVVSERPSLNEKTTAITTGSSVQAMYAIATTHRNRARAQGLRSQAPRRLT